MEVYVHDKEYVLIYLLMAYMDTYSKGIFKWLKK